ncbi:hypothetical protein H6503_06265 [Candidatus Woesearchaeota archaeon]|nr:hypothetical protein [Candidatus Woesearchaeota archaeon]
MDFDLQTFMDWWDENKEWMLIPVGVTIGIVIIGFILLLLTGSDVNVIVKTIFILLLFSAPFIGYYLGDYIDPYLEPLFAKIKNY